MRSRVAVAVISMLALSRGLQAQSDPDTARYTALADGFARVAAGTARPADWHALCGLVEGNGGWHLELKSTAYEALKNNPSAFSDRYRAGDECALILLLQGLEWPRLALDVELGCDSQDRVAISEYTERLNAIASGVSEEAAKGLVLSEVTDQALAAFNREARAHEDACKSP